MLGVKELVEKRILSHTITLDMRKDAHSLVRIPMFEEKPHEAGEAGGRSSCKNLAKIIIEALA